MAHKSIEEALPLLLKNTEVKKSEDTPTEVSAECTFPKSFIAFQGHFPENPVLPAIVQLALVRCLIEKVMGTKVVPNSYKRIKFKAMVKPEQKLLVALKIDTQDSCYTGKFKLTTSESVSVSSGSFSYRQVP